MKTKINTAVTKMYITHFVKAIVLDISYTKFTFIIKNGTKLRRFLLLYKFKMHKASLRC